MVHVLNGMDEHLALETKNGIAVLGIWLKEGEITEIKRKKRISQITETLKSVELAGCQK